MSQLVQLDGEGSSIALLVPETGMPLLLHWGVRLTAPLDNATAEALAVRASRINGLDESVAAATLLPTGGLGFFGWPALAGHRSGRDFIQSLTGWDVVRDEKSATLAARDDIVGLRLEINLELHPGGALTMRSGLVNEGREPFILDRMMAGTMMVPERATELLTFDGMWGAEFQPIRGVRPASLLLRENRRGRTSHNRYPALVLGTPGFSENAGEVWGLHLGWSGNHVVALDSLDDGRCLVHAGELFEPGEWIIDAGDEYRSPVVTMAYGAGGLESLARSFHAYVRHALLAWPGGRMRPRPVTLNTWEGNYFKHDVERLKRQAEAAAALGVERFLLDDGWFGCRDDDRSSLGDWQVDRRKYPDGLDPLIAHVRSLGMEFGLWIEPEMVNPDSDLYRAHPDWVLGVEGRPLVLSRHQLVLDLTRPEAADHVFAQIDAVLARHDISSIKWDMNRDLTAAGDRIGRAATGRQTRAVYALMDRLRSAHPAVEIESCASGGGRADFGALARAHRVWLSDCTDPTERQRIQRGASIFLPPEVVGAHVSASPNHQTHRAQTMGYRALVALPFHFGVELDPVGLSEADRRELAAWITIHKRLRPLFHGGRPFHRDPDDGRSLYGVAALDRRQAAVLVTQEQAAIRELPPPLRVPGLDAAARYRIRLLNPAAPDFIRQTAAQSDLLGGGRLVTGEAIFRIGLPLPALRPQSGILLEFESQGA